MGVINIVTRTGASLNGAMVRASGGITGTKNGAINPSGDYDMSVGGQGKRWEWVGGLRVNGDNASGVTLPSTSPAPNIPDYQTSKTARGLDLNSGVGHMKLTFHQSDDNWLRVQGYISALDRGAAFSPWQQLSYGLDAAGRQNETRVSLYNGSTSLDANYSVNSKLSLQLASQFFFGGPTSRDRIEVGSPLYFVRRHFSFFGTETSLEAHWQALSKLSFVAGASIVVDHENLPEALQILKYDAAGLPAGSILNGDLLSPQSKDFINPGAYVQGVWIAVERLLSLTGGLRYDYHNIYGSQFAGRLGVVSNPLPELYAKLLYGGAFKAPSPYLLYATPLEVGDVVGNPKLKPQYVHTLEAQVGYHAKYFKGETSVSYNYALNVAAFTLQGINQVAENLATIGSLSWETKLSVFYQQYVDAYVSLGLNSTHRNTGQAGYINDLLGANNTVYPGVIAHAGIRGQLWTLPLRLTTELTYIGDREASDSNIILHGSVYNLPAYITLDASIETTPLELLPNRKTVFSIVGKNLNGSQGPNPGFNGVDYPLMPRTLFLTVSQQL